MTANIDFHKSCFKSRAISFIAVDFVAIADAYLRARKIQSAVKYEVYYNVNTNLADHKMDDNLKFDGMTLSLWRIRKWKNENKLVEKFGRQGSSHLQPIR